MKKEDEIRIIAYEIWEREGYHNGYDVEHWIRAENEWKKQKHRDIKKRIIFSIITLVLLSGFLFYEYKSGSYHQSHLYLTVFSYVLLNIILYVNKAEEWWNLAVDFFGFEGKFSIVIYEIGILGGILISLYLLRKSVLAHPYTPYSLDEDFLHSAEYLISPF